MSKQLTIECNVHFKRRGLGGQKELVPAPAPPPAPPRVPRIAKLMALALRYDAMVRSREVEDFATLARLGHVTRARMSQIMVLVNLAPDIIEALLLLPPVEQGRDPVVLRDVLPVTMAADWVKQRRMWPQLRRAS